MLAEFWQKIREMISKLFRGKTIETALNIKPVVSNEMVDAIELWGLMYSNKSPWCREPIKGHPIKIVSMNLAASICSEKARTALIEFKSEITEPLEEITTDDLNKDNPVVAENIEKLKNDSKLSRAEYLNEQYQKKLIKKLRPQLEYGIAKGSLVIKPYVVIDKITKTDGSEMQRPRMEFEFIQADRFFPISFNGDGDITEAVFVEQKITSECKYTRLEHHKLENCKLTVTNRAYCNKQNTSNISELGEEIPLTSVSGWSNIQPTVVINYADKLGFGYFKMPTANNIDTHSPLGVSGFSRATTLIREADLQFSRLLWEFEGGTMAIDVDRDALNIYNPESDGYTPMSMLQERLYRKLDIGREDTYEVFAPTLRDQSYISGLNSILMRIEDTCEISRGTISDASIEARTATELKILRQRSYSSNDDVQKALEKALRDAVYAMDMYCTLYNIVGDAGDVENHPETVGQYEISFNWDDSIITDKDSELEKRLLLVEKGISGKVETRMWYFGETEQQAKEAIEAIKEEQPEDEMSGESGNDESKMGVKSFGIKDSQRKMDKSQVDDDITQESQKKLVKPKKD